LAILWLWLCREADLVLFEVENGCCFSGQSGWRASRFCSGKGPCLGAGWWLGFFSQVRFGEARGPFEVPGDWTSIEVEDSRFLVLGLLLLVVNWTLCLGVGGWRQVPCLAGALNSGSLSR
jgi:hypothetical protein